MPVPDNVPAQHYDDDDEDIDYTEIEERYQLDMLSGLDNVLVVDNLPSVNSDRRQKLLDRARQQFAKAGSPLSGKQREDGSYEDMEMPWDQEGDSNKGFLFLTYPTVAEATAALRNLDGTLFGKNRLHVNRFGDIERYSTLPIDSSSTPRGWVEETEIQPQEHLKSWLADEAGRDQYVTYKGDQVDLNWIGRGGAGEPAVTPEPRWGELYVSWSPQGTFLTTLHRIGVALWSGKSFQNNPLQRFTHAGVKLFDFSPCEKYLVTWSPESIVPKAPKDENAPQDPRQFGPEDEGNQIAVWEVKTGLLLRTFPGEKPVKAPVVPEGVDPKDVPAPRKMAWPLLRWSPDDKYVARCHLGAQISVYELPSMGLLEKKSIKIEGVLDFEWCPDRELGEKKENMFAYWTPEGGNQPARVSLMAIPSRNVLRSKNLFNVNDCKLHWQDQGTYLSVKVDRVKSKRSTFSNFELFRVKEKNYPVETIELKETCTQFAWEPSGNRFAAITCADPNPAHMAPGVVLKTAVEFYYLDPKKGDFKLMRQLENKTVNTIAWAPKGRFVALATVGSGVKYDIEFWDLDFTIDDTVNKRDVADPGANMQLLATGEHFGMSEIAWDPSGRYLASSASAFRQSPETGYNIWDFKGQDLQKHPLEKFKQFVWRPRPATMLAKEDQKRVRKNLREYSKQFDEEDAAEESNVSAELLAHRKRLIDEWNAWRSKRAKELAAEKQSAGTVEQKTDDGDLETVEEIVEDILEETEQIED